MPRILRNLCERAVCMLHAGMSTEEVSKDVSNSRAMRDFRTRFRTIERRRLRIRFQTDTAAADNISRFYANQISGQFVIGCERMAYSDDVCTSVAFQR